MNSAGEKPTSTAPAPATTSSTPAAADLQPTADDGAAATSSGASPVATEAAMSEGGPPTDRGSISAQSLTSGAIPSRNETGGASTLDTSGEDGTEGDALNANSTLETSADDEPLDDSDELVEEVLDDTEYDEEEIVDEEDDDDDDDDLVEEVLLSEHASDHDLVEEEVLEGSASDIGVAAEPTTGVAAPAPLEQIAEEELLDEPSENQGSSARLQSSQADLSVVEEEESGAGGSTRDQPPTAPVPVPASDEEGQSLAPVGAPALAEPSETEVGQPTPLEGSSAHSVGVPPTEAPEPSSSEVLGASAASPASVGTAAANPSESGSTAQVAPAPVLQEAQVKQAPVPIPEPSPPPPALTEPTPTPGYFRPPPPVIASASSWEEEDPTDEGVDRANELAALVAPAAAGAAAAITVEAIPEVEEVEEPQDPSASTLPLEAEGEVDVTEGTAEAETLVAAPPLVTEAGEPPGNNDSVAAAEFVLGLGASGDEEWEEAAMEHPSESSDFNYDDSAPEAGAAAAAWGVVAPVDDPSESSSRRPGDYGNSSERFADEDGTERSQGKERAAPYLVGTAAVAAAPAGVPLAKPVDVTTGSAGEKQLEFFDNEFEAHRPPEEMRKVGPEDDLDWTEGGLRRKPKMIDVLLIILIVVVIIVLVTVIPIVLVNRNKSKDIPTGPTASPQASPSPTSAPESGYVVSGGPFTGAAGSNLGAAVSIYGSVAVAGSPGAQPGALQTYTQPATGASDRQRRLRNVQESSNQLWVQTPQLLQGSEPNDLFGSSTSLYKYKMIVGAPLTFANGTETSTGAAYFFQFFNESTTWTQLGSTMRGTEDIDAVEEEFGASVSASSVYRVVVGAPQRNQGDGAVYTFVLNENTLAWNRLPETGLITNNETKEGLGSAVSISVTGDRMVAGAPNANGGSGRIFVYQWNEGGSNWIPVANITGSSGEMFGSSVICLSPAGDVVAAGAPGAEAGNGLVRVYQKMDGSFQFQQLGTDILGEVGEGLGVSGTIVGSNSAGKVVLLAGTKSGVVRMFEFDGNVWLQPIEPIDTSLSGPVTSLSADSDLSSIIAGSSPVNKAVVLRSNSRPSPTITPGGPSTFAPSVVPAPTAATPAPVAVIFPSSVPVPTAQPQPATPPPSSGTTNSPSGVGGTPTSTPLTSWTLSTSFLGDSGSNLGFSVALVSLLMAAGATSGSGFVNTYQRASNDWEFLSTISGSQQSSRFGESIAFNPSDGGLLIGAPGTLADGTSTPTGAAYYYAFSGSTWSQLGTTILGDTDVYSANEDFGASVAVSGNDVLVIGAPRSSYGNVIERGRVYTFVFDSSSTSWSSRSSGSATVGEAESDRFGSAVDISSDGGTLVVGAPSQNSGSGAVYIFTWSGSEWTLATKFSGDSAESLGSSVAVLSTSDGSVVAAGGDGYGSGSGIIRIYQLQSGSYTPLGSSIVGDAGDALGAATSLSGSGTTIVAGTVSGSVKTYSYDSGSGTWMEDRPAVATGASSNPALSGTPSLDSFVAGTGGDVQIYNGGT